MPEKSIVNCDSCLTNKISCPYKLDIGCLGCICAYIEAQPDTDSAITFALACFREINEINRR